MDRIATFRSFIQKSPADPFPRYGLAMELKGRGELDAAWSAFHELVTQFGDYVPTYLHAGGTLVARGRRDEAADIFRKGIEVATRRGDTHARGELETALAELAPDLTRDDDHESSEPHVVAALVGRPRLLAACGKKTPPASPENAGAKSGSAIAPTGATGGTGYGGMGYGGKK